MTTPILISDLLEFRVWAADDEQASVNNFHFHVDSVNNPASTDDGMAEGFALEIATGFRAVLTSNSSFQGVQCQILNRAIRPIAGESNDGHGVGTGGTPGLPRQTAGLSSWRTNIAGSKGRGRTYWPFPPEAFNESGGVPTDAAVTAYTNLSQTIQDIINLSPLGNDVDLHQVVFSRKRTLQSEVLHALIPKKWATQKRRGSFGRANQTPFG